MCAIVSSHKELPFLSGYVLVASNNTLIPMSVEIFRETQGDVEELKGTHNPNIIHNVISKYSAEVEEMEI